jgi:hypothetical protein
MESAANGRLCTFEWRAVETRGAVEVPWNRKFLSDAVPKDATWFLATKRFSFD